jgi:hypothetical protein
MRFEAFIESPKRGFSWSSFRDNLFERFWLGYSANTLGQPGFVDADLSIVVCARPMAGVRLLPGDSLALENKESPWPEKPFGHLYKVLA